MKVEENRLVSISWCQA